MKGIRKRGNAFQVDVSVGGRRITGTAKTLPEARKLQAQLRSRLASGTESETWSLGKAVDYALRTHWEDTRGYRTAAINAACLVRFFGVDLPLSEITRTSIDAFVEAMRAQGNSAGTCNRKLAALSKILRLANEVGGLPILPKFPKRRAEQQGRIRFLSEEEERNVLAFMRARGVPQYADAVAVLIDTGMRCGELFRLTCRDVDDRYVMIWETKGNTPRSIPLTKRARAVLNAWRAGKKPHELIVPFDYRELRYAWDAARSGLGYEDDRQFVLHTLRHTFASRLAQRGVGVLQLQLLLGHRDIQMTRRYSHLQPAQLEQAIGLLEKAE